MKMKSIMAGLAATFAVTAVADVQKVGNINWAYDTDDDVHAWLYGGYQVAAIDVETSGDITIPSVLGGMPVTKVEEYAFYKCEKLRHVTIPSSVTAIGDEAFKDCGLSGVTIPSSVKSIGISAFAGSSLTEVEIPSSVTTLDGSAFSGCSSLATVYYAGTASDFADVAIDNKGGGNYPFLNATFYYGFRESGVCGDDLFWSFDAETGTLTIEGSGAMTEYDSFDGAPWSFAADLMTSVYMPAGLTSVSAHAFAGCTGNSNQTTNRNSSMIIGVGSKSNINLLASLFEFNSHVFLPPLLNASASGLNESTIINHVETEIHPELIVDSQVVLRNYSTAERTVYVIQRSVFDSL